MESTAKTITFSFLRLFLLATFLRHIPFTATALGVNYGMIADNLPPPSEVANFIKTKTVFDSIKIFDTNHDVLRAFANTNISVTVTIGNGDIPSLTNRRAATRWVNYNIRPFYPQTKIKYISVGNEVLQFNVSDQIKNLVPAMKALHLALLKGGFRGIKVTTAHSLNLFNGNTMPSLTRFRKDYARSLFAPLLLFHRRTKSPFMINPYPYFALNSRKNRLNFALFKKSPGYLDRHSGKTYTNDFDVLLDKTFSAMNAMGCGDVKIIVGETGWPSKGDGTNNAVVNVGNAVSYNGNLVKKVVSGKGTPLMPKRRFEVYMFALFNENQKPGPVTEKNWGLFQPDFTPVYDAGVLLNIKRTEGAGKKFCVAKAGASNAALQANIDYICSKGTDCNPIQPGGACAEPAGTLSSRASFAMNSYYKKNGQADSACYFSGTGQITNIDPSHGNCHFL